MSKVLHSLVVGGPLGPDEPALLVDLVLEVVAEGVESINEVLFKGVECLVHDIHLLHRELLVVGDVPAIALKRDRCYL